MVKGSVERNHELYPKFEESHGKLLTFRPMSAIVFEPSTSRLPVSKAKFLDHKWNSEFRKWGMFYIHVLSVNMVMVNVKNDWKRIAIFNRYRNKMRIVKILLNILYLHYYFSIISTRFSLCFQPSNIYRNISTHMQPNTQWTKLLQY